MTDLRFPVGRFDMKAEITADDRARLIDQIAELAGHPDHRSGQSGRALLLVPLDDIVVFPNMNVTLAGDVGDEERVLLVPRHENDYASVGTVCRVAQTTESSAE